MTVPGDSCNAFGGSLVVDSLCADDRLTKNRVTFCPVKAQIFGTQMSCNDTEFVPVIVKIDLDENNVAKEAQTLILSYWGKTIEVSINK